MRSALAPGTSSSFSSTSNSVQVVRAFVDEVCRDMQRSKKDEYEVGWNEYGYERGVDPHGKRKRHAHHKVE